jgi:predicted RNase H-like HicB family nuclease
MTLELLFDREDDGRWIVEIPSLPGVMCYGSTRDEARRAAVVLALRVLADKVEHGEIQAADVSFRDAA